MHTSFTKHVWSKSWAHWSLLASGGMIKRTKNGVQVTHCGLRVLNGGYVGEQWQDVLYLINLITPERSHYMCSDRGIVPV